MTKPNEFYINSDFLALAQTETAEFTAYFAAETFPGGQQINREQDFTLKATPGAIDQVLISRNSGDYIIGNSLTVSPSGPTLVFTVYRPNANTIRVRLHEYNGMSGGYSMPAQTIKIKVSSFKPPNVV